MASAWPSFSVGRDIDTNDGGKKPQASHDDTEAWEGSKDFMSLTAFPRGQKGQG